ncbi:hypothetical protein MNBD_GAMMA07-947 [hydrothermal vent metagenome]|uniref:non-specific serine/threonine protein kinase n=1 Tax=hydrothermal vent metagenome TaxID=652676 RepID=A0A3B0WUF4_9ZZZZ
MNQTTYRDVLELGFVLHWYEIKSVLGRGAFGVTYLAWDKNLDQQVAIKEYFPREFSSRDTGFTVHPSTGESQELYDWGLDRFIREAQTLAKFKHHNIVRVMSVFELNNTAYMIMEYEEGEDLSRLYKKNKNLSEQALLDIFIPMLNGLKLVHNEGFIHRDIKPANIYIRSDSSPVLIDFGAARKTAGAATRSITSLVTHGYAPFEQYNESNEKQGAWTDIYALGACLYCAINGKLPIDALARGSNLLSSGRDAYEPLSVIKKGEYSEGFLLAIDNALMFQASARPQDVLIWADMLSGKIESPALPDNMQYVPIEVDDEATVVVSSPSLSPSSVPSRAPSQAPSQAPSSLSQRLNKKPQTASVSSQNKTIDNFLNIYQLFFKNTKSLITIIVVLAVFGGGISFYLLDKKTNKHLSETEKAQLVIFLESADNARRDDNLIETQNSAIYFYVKALNVDADNSEAKSRIRDIIEFYIGGIKSDLDAGYVKKAESNIKLLQAAIPDSEELKQLAKTINLSKDKRQKINELLQLAETELKLGNITRPKDKNAVFLYRKVLKLDSDNKIAKNELDAILINLVNEAKNNLINRKMNDLDKKIADILIIDPDSQDVKNLRNKIKTISQDIDKNIAQAKRAYDLGNVISPRNKNALVLYRKVLKIDSNNVEAKAGIKKITKFITSLFNKKIKAKQYKSAKNILINFDKYMPKSRLAKKMHADLKKSTKKSKSGFKMVNDMIGKFKKKFESRNIDALQKISQFQPNRKSFLKQFFGNYKSFTLGISGIKYIGSENKGTADIALFNLVNSRGGKVKAGAWSKFKITIRKNTKGQWKVIW